MAAGAKGGGAGAFAGAAGGVDGVYTWPWHFVPNHAPVTLKTVSEGYALFSSIEDQPLQYPRCFTTETSSKRLQHSDRARLTLWTSTFPKARNLRHVAGVCAS